MLRVVRLKLIAGLNRTCVISGTKLDADGSNLTRLDDFFEEEVAGGLASAGSCDPRSHGAGDWQSSWLPIGRLNLKGRANLAVT